MASRKQLKLASAMKQIVSEIITRHLDDPRIEAFTSVTKVEVTSDLRKADVYISAFGAEESARKKSFIALQHARSRIQYLLGNMLNSRFCPAITLKQDTAMKKTIETLRVIEQVSEELREKDAEKNDQSYE